MSSKESKRVPIIFVPIRYAVLDAQKLHDMFRSAVNSCSALERRKKIEVQQVDSRLDLRTTMTVACV